MKTKSINGKYFVYLILFLYVAVLLLFCSSTSPIYKSHNWVDSNIFYAIGNGWLNGKVLYRDIADMKGPFLFVIYMLGALIDGTSFTGVFVMQLISMFITGIFLYKTAFYLTSSKLKSLFAVGISLFFIFSANIYFDKHNYDCGGGSSEEFCLPFFALSLWLLTKNEKEEKWNFISIFILGLAAGAVFQIKYNLCFFWIGLLSPVFFNKLYHKEFKKCLQIFFGFLLGFVCIQLPYLLYAFCTGSFDDYIRNYFMISILYGGKGEFSFIQRILHMFDTAIGVMARTLSLPIAILGSVLGGIVISNMRNRWKLGILLSMICALIAIMINQTNPYSYLPLQLYSLFFAIGLMEIFTIKSNLKNIALPFLGVMIFFGTFVENGVLHSRLKLSGEIPLKKQVADIVKNGPIEDAKIFEFNMLSRGFYNELQQIPPIRYFQYFNMDYDYFPEPLDMHLNYIKSGKADYLISSYPSDKITEKSYDQIFDEKITKELYEAAFQNYNLIAVLEDKEITQGLYYYVFMRKDY